MERMEVTREGKDDESESVGSGFTILSDFFGGALTKKSDLLPKRVVLRQSSFYPYA